MKTRCPKCKTGRVVQDKVTRGDGSWSFHCSRKACNWRSPSLRPKKKVRSA